MIRVKVPLFRIGYPWQAGSAVKLDPRACSDVIRAQLRTLRVKNVCDNRVRAARAHLALPRFAVAAFNTWTDAHNAVDQLRDGLKPLQDISYLGLRTKLQALPIQTLTDLAFPLNERHVVCSAGHIADQLAARVVNGAPTLQAALCTWLIPRHAEQIQQTVDKGQIVIWVRLEDADDERGAYRALLAAGCGWVGVHDLI